MTTLTPLTANQIKMVNREIEIAKTNLNKELSISEDLQYANRIATLKFQIEKLNNIILNGWNAPKFN